MKAILVIEMPKSCNECDFIDEEYHFCNVVWFGKDVRDYVACRHENCPLRELPEKITSWKGKSTNYQQGHRDGYNACIDEILGDKE